MKKVLLLLSVVTLVLTAVFVVGCAKDAQDVYAVSVSVPPQKLSYYAGEALDMTGCKLLVRTHSGNDYTVDVTNDMVKGFNNNYGDHTMTISYEIGSSVFNTTLKYSVTNPFAVSAEITKNPDKLVYVDGDRVDLSGIVVRVKFSDGSEGDRTENAFSVTPAIVTMGMSEVSAKINNVTVTIPVTVEQKAVSAITVSTLPKTSYLEGDYFDATGMVVKYVYNNGEIGSVATYFVDSQEPLRYGETSVEVFTYNANAKLTAKVPIIVEKRNVSSIVADISKIKTVFLKDMPVDLEGLTATVVCEDSTIIAELDDLDLYVGGVPLSSKTLPVGTSKVDVYYKYATDSTAHDTVTITVTSEIVLTGFKLVSPIEQTEYQVGDEVSLRGLWLFGVYNDGSEEEVANGFDFAEGVTYSPETVAEDDTEIVLSYKNLTYSIPITVVE